jgi:hypothetical protein
MKKKNLLETAFNISLNMGWKPKSHVSSFQTYQKIKKIALLIVLVIFFSSCEKDQDTTPNTNNNATTPTPTATCCLTPFVPTNTISSTPDSIFTKLGASTYRWEKWYVTITNGTNYDTLWTSGYEGYLNNPPNNSSSCLIFREFGNILGFVSKTNNYFKSAVFAIYMPLDSNQVLNFPKGKYGFEKYYGASFNNDIGPRCKGAIHLQYAANNELYRSLPQTNTSVYYNEIQEIKFYKYNGALKIYSIKGIAKIPMENQVNFSISTVNVKYRVLVQYGG